TVPSPGKRGGVDLPPEEPSPFGSPGGQSPADAGVSDDLEERVRAGIRRRNRIAIAAVVICLLGVAGAIGGKAVAKRMQQKAPPDAIAARDSALSQLRFDDPVSQGQAIVALKKLVAQSPIWASAHAALVVAASLQF